MLIKCTKIDGAKGEVVINRTGRGAEVSVGFGDSVASFVRDESSEVRWPSVLAVAKAIYGERRGGQVAATNSMVHEVADLIATIAD